MRAEWPSTMVRTMGTAKWARVGNALDAVNEAFHNDYDRVRGEAVARGPVFVVLADSLLLFRGEAREDWTITPPLFHVIKSVAHAPLAIYAILHSAGGTAIRGATRSRLAALRQHLTASLQSLPADVRREVADDLRAVLDASLAFAERVDDAGCATADDVHAFARSIGSLLVRLTDHATRVQLASLDDVVTRAVATMSVADRQALQVVVTGDHQARARSLAMQYFRKRLREPEGSEERVTYGEGVTEEREALALIGTRRVDRDVALAFFGDAKRLQRDVLGDSARELLEKAELPGID